jgi:hypothetical protein
MHRFVSLGLGCMLLLATAAPASAAPPVITEIVQVRVDLPFLEEPCAQGFEVLYSATINRRSITTLDEAGNVVLDRRHVNFTGTLKNSMTGTTLPYTGHFTRVFEPATGRLIFVGLVRRTTVPGIGTIELDAGISVIDDPSGDTLFEAGRHEYVARICDLLA